MSIFPTFPLYDSATYIQVGKWNNSYGNNYNIESYHTNDTWEIGTPFDIEIQVINTAATRTTIRTTLNVILLGTDTDNPFLYGSVGLRNYKLPAQFTKFYIEHA